MEAVIQFCSPNENVIELRRSDARMLEMKLNKEREDSDESWSALKDSLYDVSVGQRTTPVKIPHEQHVWIMKNVKKQREEERSFSF